jgi:ssDNA-binding Zn-finger/Zn-ribbon topoisomerase 1
MGNGGIDLLHYTCVDCGSPVQRPKLKAPRSFSMAVSTCPKCRRLRSYRPQELAFSPQEEQRLLSERLDVLNRRLASLKNHFSDVDRSPE